MKSTSIQSTIFPEEEEKSQSEINKENTLKLFESKAKQLSDKYKTDVKFYFFTEYDKDYKPTGKIFVAYLKQAPVLALARAMDMAINSKMYEAGHMLWAVTFLPESDKEIENTPKYQVGLMGIIGASLDIQAPEVKKN